MSSLHNVLLCAKKFIEIQAYKLTEVKSTIYNFLRMNKYYVKEKIADFGGGRACRANAVGSDRHGVSGTGIKYNFKLCCLYL